jgi:catalase (peroxidase I)
LDKARALLYPLKQKYGAALSWGDLFITAGSQALRSMGAPLSNICFGRIDDPDGNASLALGPTPLQKRVAPCAVNGRCQEPLGTTTVGLIYLNPEGPVTEEGGKPNPDPVLSAADVRDAFLRMGDEDRATVALIGGGHAIGKTHGACPAGAGPPPDVAYKSTPLGTPWPGLCGSGRGNDTFTSGFEGPWTTRPLQWDNEFFRDLLEQRWEKHIGPGGHWQWRIVDPPEGKAGLMRLTSDVALLHDPAFLAAVREFAADMDAFNQAFDEAWFKLTVARGALWAPSARCDSGPLPEAIRSAPVMLGGDADLGPV